METKTILAVDDTATNLDILIEFLDEYEVIDTTDGHDALEIVKEEKIDLILLDIVMPEIDGYEVCKKLKEDPETKDIPVIFLTRKSDEESIAKAYQVGGVDYVTKPFKKEELISRVNTHLSLSQQKFLLQDMVRQKTKELEETNKELENIQQELIHAMGVVGESRCSDTGAHVDRVSEFSRLLATLYGVNESDVEILAQASPMHDIGKVAIADNILHKPAKLTSDEFEIMKSHASIGYNMFRNSNRKLLQTAAIISHQHHEKWDGSGYPQGLAGEDIHIFGRITALTDVFDALGAKRVYKDPMPDEKIIDIIKGESGKHFEPKLVELFLDNFEKFVEIREKLQ